MGKKTPEGVIKDDICLDNGNVSIDELIIFKNFTGFVSYEDKHGKRRGYRAGLTKEGSSDLIGILKLKITPAMVGKTVGVFCAFEVKTKTGKPTPEQKKFIEDITEYGGIAGVVRKSVEVRETICQWVAKLLKKR